METLDRVIRRYEPEIRRWVSRRVMRPEDADDLAQECILALIKSYNTFRSRSSLRSWIYAVCRNQYYRFLNTEAKRAAPLETDLTDERRGGPELAALQQIAADTLPARLRSVYELRFVEGWPVREVAEFLDRPEGTVKFQLHEIRRILRPSLLNE